jgi:hypothetical protein
MVELTRAGIPHGEGWVPCEPLGSGARRSDRPRRVLIARYADPSANCFSYPGSGTGRTLVVA